MSNPAIVDLIGSNRPSKRILSMGLAVAALISVFVMTGNLKPTLSTVSVFIVITPIWLFWLTSTMRRRRNIFLRNFKVEHLYRASPCEIIPLCTQKSVRLKDSTAHLCHGKLFQVVGRPQVYVIYNGKLSSNKGLLLHYEGHYYFVPQSMLTRVEATLARAA